MPEAPPAALLRARFARPRALWLERALRVGQSLAYVHAIVGRLVGLSLRAADLVLSRHAVAAAGLSLAPADG
jgi:hypothetical protein